MGGLRAAPTQRCDRRWSCRIRRSWRDLVGEVRIQIAGSTDAFDEALRVLTSRLADRQFLVLVDRELRRRCSMDLETWVAHVLCGRLQEINHTSISTALRNNPVVRRAVDAIEAERATFVLSHLEGLPALAALLEETAGGVLRELPTPLLSERLEKMRAAIKRNRLGEDDQRCPGCGLLMRAVSGETTLTGSLPCPKGHGDHDTNRVVVSLVCPNGHRLKGRARLTCPCGWVADEGGVS